MSFFCFLSGLIREPKTPQTGTRASLGIQLRVRGADYAETPLPVNQLAAAGPSGTAGSVRPRRPVPLWTCGGFRVLAGDCCEVECL